MQRAAAVVLALLTGTLPATTTAPATATTTTTATTGPAPRAAASVCSVYCDTRDPSLARQDTFPVADRIQNGRRISLHLSAADAMAWGSIDNGSTGDAVWLDRTFDGGATWDGLLGKASIPGTWTGTRTLMYNLSDPVRHARGMIRACGDAGGVQCTDWVPSQVCDVACDGAATGTGDTMPVPSATLPGRTIALHMDARGMAWGVISGGAPGDEIWLDRSFDEGASWPGGSSLGRTATAPGASSARTGAYAVRDAPTLMYGGAVRACGRAVTGNNGSCTGWARPAGDRAAAAADALMYAYRPDTAWWPSSWWNSAATLTAVINWMQRSGRGDYRWIVARTFEVNRGTFAAGERSSDPIEGHFISRAVDDAAWWGLAWVQAYDLTGEVRYRDEAVTIASYVHGFWDTGTCGGGVWWNRERTYKNAVTIGLYVRLAAALHNRIPGDTVWRDRAVTGWKWFAGSGLINASGLVNDGLTTACANNGQTVWSYNQGLAVGAAVEVYRATGDASVLAAARRLADAAIGSPVLTRGGVLTESCDAADRSCDDNAKQFKGVFLRYLGDLATVTGDAGYRGYARTQADSIWSADRDALNRIGERWNGQTSAAYPNVRDWRTQASGLEALTAAL
ncbi:glycoside hydrolase family 76 protein [Mangrovihabitans endophyticus]|uniref:Glycosyl hydrolase family 76 n=1 Tax=Mangrovihabitans endophyticus TaxID=1751298 RepID=A0A8J3C7D7_9ACTN|nr:glycoside hydrolase family 76 protein [Mangrovihabitans endophyticus]GGL16747.1 hypothetical protein GCM10012284_59140 [Mangrovihabitans endophyticus]